jgi:hypothetical protein
MYFQWIQTISTQAVKKTTALQWINLQHLTPWWGFEPRMLFTKAAIRTIIFYFSAILLQWYGLGVWALDQSIYRWNLRWSLAAATCSDRGENLERKKWKWHRWSTTHRGEIWVIHEFRSQSYDFGISNYTASVVCSTLDRFLICRRNLFSFQNALRYSYRCNFLQRWHCSSSTQSYDHELQWRTCKKLQPN